MSSIWARLKAFWQRRWEDGYFPCAQFREDANRNFGCICGWNLSAHGDDAIARVLGPDAVREKHELMDEGEWP